MQKGMGGVRRKLASSKGRYACLWCLCTDFFFFLFFFEVKSPKTEDKTWILCFLNFNYLALGRMSRVGILVGIVEKLPRCAAVPE